MNSSIYNPKKTTYKKQKSSVFRQLAQPQKQQLKKLLTRLSQSYEANEQKKISQIIQYRDRKLTELRQKRPKFIWQNPVIVSASTQQFSTQKPISIGQQFLSQKIKANILAPDKMFNGQPNMRAGSIDQSKMISYDRNDDPRVINKKFEEFVRLLNQQSGTNKRKKYSQRETKVQNQSLPVIKSPYKITMKKTYFKKFPSDQYNFYKPPIKQISRVQKIFQLTTHRQSTQQSRSKSRQIQKVKSRQSSPRVYNTLEINLNSYRQRSNNNSNNNFNVNYSTGAKTLDAYRNA